MVLLVVLVRILILETGCKDKTTSKGFTLIEILVVIIIIGITTTLITLNFSAVNSIEKQINTIDKKFSYLTEESIITGKVIGWYATDNGHYASFLSDNNTESKNEFFLEAAWTDDNVIKKIFKFADGTNIELKNNSSKRPILIFYPSGENSGGTLELHYSDYIQKIIIKNNADIRNEITRY